MQNTPNFAISYPEPGDHTRTWEYWQTQATQLDNLLKANRTATFVTSTTITSPTSSITLNPPAGAMALRISVRARSDAAGDLGNLYMRINGNATPNYVYKHFWSLASDQPVTNVVWGDGAAVVGLVCLAGAAPGHMAVTTMEFAGWSVTGQTTISFNTHSFGTSQPTTTVTVGLRVGGGYYGGPSPYQTLSFWPQAGNFVAGTVITLEATPYTPSASPSSAPAPVILGAPVSPTTINIPDPPNGQTA